MLTERNKKNIKRVVIYTPLLIVLFFVSLWFYANFFYHDETYERQSLSNYYPAYTVTADNKTSVLQGEYLVKLGNCLTCHTNKKRGGQPFAGGLMISTPFGSVASTNITPDKKTGIGDWTKSQFIEAMTKGLSPEGKHYYPAFPYLYFSNISTEDLGSIYDYLQAIPAVSQQNISPSFPLNIWGFRQLVRFWNVFGFGAKPKLLARDVDPMLQIGAYITNGLGHCGMCHTNRNSMGMPKAENYLAGAFVGGFWAPNISKQGLRETPLSELIKVFSKGELMNDGGPLAGPMADVSHNSLQFLTERDANAIGMYLKQVESKPVMSIAAVLPEQARPNFKRGQEVYFQVCLVCHETGRASAPKIGSAGNWYNRALESGLQTLYDRTYDGFNNMPKFGGCVNCTKNDIISAVDYMVRGSLSSTQWAQVQYLKTVQQNEARKQQMRK